MDIRGQILARLQDYSRSYGTKRNLNPGKRNEFAADSADSPTETREPFFTTKEIGKGVGLGLALTYNIAKRYGRDIRLVNRVGGGLQFTVLLPIWRG